MEHKRGAVTLRLTKCLGCGEEFSSYDEFIDHVVVAHNVTCQVCGEGLNSKRDLLQHNRERHGIG
jgi:hypothetical protein